MLEKLQDISEKITKHLMFYIMAVLIIAVFLQVFARVFVLVPMVWTEELARYAFVWMVFLGASIGVKKHTHFSLTFIIDKFPAFLKKFINIFITSLIFIAIIVMLIQGTRYTLFTGLKSSAPHLGISMAFVFSAIPVSALLMLLYLVVDIKKLILAKDSEEND
jgi:TRAP-type C4-dicarboxylate transport system permease small subunit